MKVLLTKSLESGDLDRAIDELFSHKVSRGPEHSLMTTSEMPLKPNEKYRMHHVLL